MRVRFLSPAGQLRSTPCVSFVRNISESVLAVSEALSGATGAAFVTAGTRPYTILDVNDAWLATCGFSKREVVGKTARIIQGPHTEVDELATLMKGVDQGQRTEVTLTNYTVRSPQHRILITL